MSRVLLIYPPNQLNPTETPRPDGSLGPLYLASALEEAGLEVDVVDASVGTAEDSLNETFYRAVEQPNGLIRIGMTTERLRELVVRGGYAVVAIHSNFTPQTRMVLELAGIVKDINPRTLVVSGGVSARNMSRRLLTTGLIDIICTSEGERIIVKLARQWLTCGNFDGVDGVIFKGNGDFVERPAWPQSVVQNLDELPVPAWHKLPLDKFTDVAAPRGDVLLGERLVYAPMMTSRGCPFWCDYCHISMEKNSKGDIGNLRLKSVGRVVREIEILKSLGVQRVHFEDESLLAKKPRIREIFQHLLGCGLKMADGNGVNLVHLFARDSASGKLRVDQELLELLFETGLYHISFPIESASQKILNKYASGKLKLETMDVMELVRVASRIGITCPVGIMMGFPEETEEEILQGVELGKKLVEAGAKYCSFYIVVPFPGSKLYHTAIAEGHLKEDFDPDLMNWHRPVMKNTLVPPERLWELREWAWHTVNSQEYVADRVARNASQLLSKSSS